MGSETRGQTLPLTGRQVTTLPTEIFESNADAQRISKETTIMKPTFPTIVSSLRRESFDGGKFRTQRTPLTDYNYHSVTFKESSAPYVRNRARSFWNITGDYVKNEARYDLWGEAALLVVLALTAFLPLISNAHAVMEFVRAISGS
jgi:hypothetical protein